MTTGGITTGGISTGGISTDGISTGGMRCGGSAGITSAVGEYSMRAAEAVVESYNGQFATGGMQPCTNNASPIVDHSLNNNNSVLDDSADRFKLLTELSSAAMQMRTLVTAAQNIQVQAGVVPPVAAQGCCDGGAYKAYVIDAIHASVLNIAKLVNCQVYINYHRDGTHDLASSASDSESVDYYFDAPVEHSGGSATTTATAAATTTATAAEYNTTVATNSFGNRNIPTATGAHSTAASAGIYSDTGASLEATGEYSDVLFSTVDDMIAGTEYTVPIMDPAEDNVLELLALGVDKMLLSIIFICGDESVPFCIPPDTNNSKSHVRSNNDSEDVLQRLSTLHNPHGSKRYSAVLSDVLMVLRVFTSVALEKENISRSNRTMETFYTNTYRLSWTDNIYVIRKLLQLLTFAEHGVFYNLVGVLSDIATMSQTYCRRIDLRTVSPAYRFLDFLHTGPISLACRLLVSMFVDVAVHSTNQSDSHIINYIRTVDLWSAQRQVHNDNRSTKLRPIALHTAQQLQLHTAQQPHTAQQLQLHTAQQPHTAQQLQLHTAQQPHTAQQLQLHTAQQPH
eukprot:Lankesteria_metandrocarpae@DN8231_c0_g1_i1.p1